MAGHCRTQGVRARQLIAAPLVIDLFPEHRFLLLSGTERNNACISGNPGQCSMGYGTQETWNPRDAWRAHLTREQRRMRATTSVLQKYGRSGPAGKKNSVGWK